MRPAASSDATRVIPAVVPADVPKGNALDDPPRTAGSSRRPAVAIGALVVALALAALVAFAALDQPGRPEGDAVVPPSQEATAAPSAPPTAEPVVNAGGKADGGGGGKDDGGKGKGRDDKGKGKGKN